jgi:hypothetical protein
MSLRILPPGVGELSQRFGNTFISILKGISRQCEMLFKKEIIAFPKLRDNSLIPGGDIPKEVVVPNKGFPVMVFPL